MQDIPEEKKLKEKNYFNLFWITSLLYMSTILFKVTYNSDYTKIVFDWRVALILLLLPVSGLFLHFTMKKIGWIVNAFYYLCMTSLIIGILLATIIKEKDFYLNKYNLPGLLLLLFGLSATFSLFTLSIRFFFKINNLINLITIGLALTAALIIFIFVQS